MLNGGSHFIRIAEKGEEAVASLSVSPALGLLTQRDACKALISSETIVSFRSSLI